MRDFLLQQDRVFIGWGSYRARDFVSVLRCFKCLGYGHSARNCSKAEAVCGHCCMEGHIVSACPSRQLGPVCGNCKLRGRDSGHHVRSLSCPEYSRVMSVYLNSICYE